MFWKLFWKFQVIIVCCSNFWPKASVEENCGWGGGSARKAKDPQKLTCVKVYWISEHVILSLSESLWEPYGIRLVKNTGKCFSLMPLSLMESKFNSTPFWPPNLAFFEASLQSLIHYLCQSLRSQKEILSWSCETGRVSEND